MIPLTEPLAFFTAVKRWQATLRTHASFCTALIRARPTASSVDTGRQHKQKSSFDDTLPVNNRDDPANVYSFDFLLPRSGQNDALKRRRPCMKRLLYSLTAAFVAAVVVLAGNNAVVASDKQALDPVRNTAGNGPDVLAQNASPKEVKSNTTAKVSVDNQGVILKGYDVVAYFKQGKPVKGDSAIESTYQGATYLFVSSAHKADFDKDPAKYAPQYGAFCSYGVANGVMTGIADPDAFAVYKGKLYLCGNQAALKGFKTNIDSNIEKADTNWRQLNGP
jgi:YHS domain-containing protein